LGEKAKFHYASWFEAGSKLVADSFEIKFHYAIWFGAASKLVADRFEAPTSNLSATCFEPASVMEFGFKHTKKAQIFATSISELT